MKEADVKNLVEGLALGIPATAMTPVSAYRTWASFVEGGWPMAGFGIIMTIGCLFCAIMGIGLAFYREPVDQ